MKELKKIAKGSLIVFIGIIFSKIIGYFFRLIVARISVEDYGLFNIGLGLYSFIGIISLLGLSNGIIRYVSYHKDNKKKTAEIIGTALKIVLPLSIVFCILLFVFSGFIAENIFHNINLADVLRRFAFLIPFFAMANIFSSVIKAFQKIEYSVYATNFAEGIFRISVTLALVLLGYGLFGAMAGFFSGVIAMFLLSLYYFKKIFPYNINGNLNKELILYSYPLLFSGVLWLIVRWADTMMIGYFLDVSKVGIYNVASPTANLMLVIPTALLGLFLPVSTALYSKNKDYSYIFKKTSKWMFIINLPLLLLMVFFSKQIIIILFGKEYVSGALCLSILAAGFFVYFFFMTNIHIFMMLKKTRLIFFINLIIAIINIIMNLILIPKYGIEGGAIATSISLLTASLLIIYFSGIIIKIKRLDFDYLKIILTGIISASAVYLISSLFLVDKTPIYALIPMFVVFVLVYFLILILFRIITKEDFKIFKSIFKKKVVVLDEGC